MAEGELDILAIGAHPDDVEMTSGGYMALAAKQGKRVGALHLTKGEMGTRGTPEERVEEAKAAGRVLGLASVDFAGLQDGHVQCDDESTATVVRFLRTLKPKLVIAPFTICHHPDHEQAAHIVLRAVHLAGKVKYDTDTEPHVVAGMVHARYSHAFEPSYYVDISSVIDIKKEAILCYFSQFQPKEGEPETRLSNPSFLDQLTARGHAYGLATGVEHAEMYRSVGPLVARDPLSLFLDQAPLSRLAR